MRNPLTTTVRTGVPGLPIGGDQTYLLSMSVSPLPRISTALAWEGAIVAWSIPRQFGSRHGIIRVAWDRYMLQWLPHSWNLQHFFIRLIKIKRCNSLLVVCGMQEETETHSHLAQYQWRVVAGRSWITGRHIGSVTITIKGWLGRRLKGRQSEVACQPPGVPWRKARLKRY